MKASELVKYLSIKDYKFETDCEILTLSPIDNLVDNCLSFIEFHRDIDLYKDKITDKNLIIVWNDINDGYELWNKGNFIASDNSKLTFVKMANYFLKYHQQKEERIIGKNFKVGSLSVVKNCIIGNNVTLHSGVVIGESGFGYIQDEHGTSLQFPHIGKVIIEDDVCIHSNVCIDRGALSNTIIRRGVRIDNMVHVAHNVEIGENTYVTAGVTFSGSVKVGKNCWIAPGSVLMDGITIADDTFIGLGSVVLKNIKNPGEIWVGNPARKLKDREDV
jgi:acetyltransferase-like isoleucine patch superfamily enzyme